MTRNVPKTGLTGRMREWMSGRKYPFTSQQICEVLEIPHGKDRNAVYQALTDFVRRGEVVATGKAKKQNRRQPLYHYNPGWYRINKGLLNKRIYKAMRLISFKEPFTVNDIQRAVGMPDRNWIEKVTRHLLDQKYLNIVDERINGRGCKERAYRVTDPDRFRLEVMR